MIRTKNIAKPNPSAILCGDFHLRETIPVCRTDDFLVAQCLKMGFVSGLQRRYGCPVIHSGDLFDHWKPSPYLLSLAIKFLPDNFYTIYGQHDLPQHSLDLVSKCGINTLLAAGKVKVLEEAHWGQIPTKGSMFFPVGPGRKMLAWHILTWQGNLPWPGAEIPSAHTLLKNYPDYDLILTGDNHKTFTEELDGRILVNPGSLMRQDADQGDHKPCVFLWYAESNTVKQVFVPIGKDVISREHIEHKQERDKRIEAFVERLDSSQLTGFDFRGNLEEFERSNQIRKSVMDIVWRAVDNV
jgi:hypothetical protein